MDRVNCRDVNATLILVDHAQKERERVQVCEKERRGGTTTVRRPEKLAEVSETAEDVFSREGGGESSRSRDVYFD